MSRLGDKRRRDKVHQKQTPNFVVHSLGKSQLPSVRPWREGWKNYLHYPALEGKRDWESGQKTVTYVGFSSPFPGSPETLCSFEEVFLQVELLTGALTDCSPVTGMDYPFTNFVPREHLFLFGAFLGIDFDSNLSCQNKKKKESSQSIFVLVESNIAFQTRFFLMVQNA